MSRAQAMSAFMFFSNANRERVKADNPGIAFGEVGRKLGELWRAATADEKKEYDEQAAADKVRAGYCHQNPTLDHVNLGPRRERSTRSRPSPTR